MYPTAKDRVSGCFIEEQVEALRGLGVDSTVISPQPVYPLRRYVRESLRPGASAEADGVLRPRYYCPRGAIEDLRIASFVECCARAVDRIRYARFDLVHAHTALLDGSAGAYLAGRLAVPLVITEHTGPFSMLIDTPIERRVTREAFGRARKIIAVSRFLAGEIAGFLGPELGDRMEVIGNGYSERIFKPDPSAIPPSARAARHLLFVGYFQQNKRVDLVLEAFRRLAEERKDLELHLIGGEKVGVDLGAMIGALPPGVAERVHVHGLVDRETVALYMQQRCDALLLASDYETFGVVIIEAIAAGKPVVATRCGGPEDTVTPDVGELVPKGDAGALAEGLARVLDHLDRFEPARLNAHAKARFSFREIAPKVRAVYEAALAGGR
jgi:glycosyltransferase involved in cell wall biosynthesis